MKITDVQIKVISNTGNGDKLIGFAKIVFNGWFIIRDLKIIDHDGKFIVAMPSRKITVPCPSCHRKNHMRAKFCNDCGSPLPVLRKNDNGEQEKLYADIAHPVHPDCRRMIDKVVLMAYGVELHRSRQPGYICRYEEFHEETLKGEPVCV